MLARSLLVLALLLSADLGVDAKKRGRSPRKPEKLYRKSKRYAKKLRGFWQRLGVQPFIVEEGKVGEPCMLKSEVEAGYLRRSAVSRDYVRKSDVACAGVVVEGDVGDVGGGVDEEKETLSPRETAKLYRKAGKFQKKLRSAWALLGVRPYLVQVTRSATAASTTTAARTSRHHCLLLHRHYHHSLHYPPPHLPPLPTSCSRARRATSVCSRRRWRRTGC